MQNYCTYLIYITSDICFALNPQYNYNQANVNYLELFGIKQVICLQQCMICCVIQINYEYMIFLGTLQQKVHLILKRYRGKFNAWVITNNWILEVKHNKHVCLFASYVALRDKFINKQCDFLYDTSHSPNRLTLIWLHLAFCQPHCVHIHVTRDLPEVVVIVCHTGKHLFQHTSLPF